MINTYLSTALNGINSAEKKVSDAAERITGAFAEDNATGGANLPRDIVDLKIGEIEFKANVKVVEVADELSKELFKIFDEEV